MQYMRRAFNLITRWNKAGTRNENARNVWVQKVLQDLPPGLRLLDAGAGEQQYKKYCAHLVYVSQDFAQYDGRGNSAGLQTGNWNNANLDIVSDITAIPEPDASFDVVLCTEVFEHLPNPALAIREFSRLLKSGGKLIITAPFCSLTHFAPYHFATGFNKYYYEKQFAENGLSLVSIEANGNYFEYMAQELRRIEDVAQQYSEKKHPNILQRIALWLLLHMLNRMSKTDSGSDQLLCYGYHVVATRA